MNHKTMVLGGVALTCALVASALVRKAMFDDDSTNWPPKVGAAYPNLSLRDLHGKEVSLADYQGRPILLELIGMPCPACQAFAGGHEVGSFAGVRPQPGIRSLGFYVKNYGRGMYDGGFINVQVLCFGKDAKSAPTLKEAREWYLHFQSANPKTIVLYGDRSLADSATAALIPGFHLIDRDFVLRCEAGNSPKSSLYGDLIPQLRDLVLGKKQEG